MTLARQESSGAPEEPAAAAGSGRYHISLERLERLGRSAAHIIADRLSEACPSYPRKDSPGRLDAMTLIREIREFHDDVPGYIRGDLPVQEIVFRMLLTRGNEATHLSELHQELTGRWSSPLRPIGIDEARLRQVLAADRYYGFEEV